MAEAYNFANSYFESWEYFKDKRHFRSSSYEAGIVQDGSHRALPANTRMTKSPFQCFTLYMYFYKATNAQSRHYGPLTRYVKLRVARIPGTICPPLRVSDPDMQQGTCVTHVPWCMPGSLTSHFCWIRRGGGGNVPGIPGACATRNFSYLVWCLWEALRWREILRLRLSIMLAIY